MFEGKMSDNLSNSGHRFHNVKVVGRLVIPHFSAFKICQSKIIAIPPDRGEAYHFSNLALRPDTLKNVELVVVVRGEGVVFCDQSRLILASKVIVFSIQKNRKRKRILPMIRRRWKKREILTEVIMWGVLIF